jgi:hypothetical protein
VIQFLHQKSQGQMPIIGVGGIFTAQDAWEKLNAGATLLQVYTGWIYGGPEMVRRVLTGLTNQLDRHQLSTLSAAIGQNLPLPSRIDDTDKHQRLLSGVVDVLSRVGGNVDRIASAYRFHFSINMHVALTTQNVINLGRAQCMIDRSFPCWHHGMGQAIAQL